MKKIIKKIINSTGYTLTKAKSDEIGKVAESEFLQIYDDVKEYTMISRVNLYALYKSVEYILNKKIEGDFVECGVWRGGAVMMIAYMLKKRNITDRKIYIYDTFEGMSEPTKKDIKINALNFNVTDYWNSVKKNDIVDWAYGSLEEVKQNLEKTKIDSSCLIYVKGKVEDTIPKVSPEIISLLRLDTDWYESTKHELSHLYPTLSKGGVLIIDDYGSYQGSKDATDEYFKENPILLTRVDLGSRITIKV